MGMPNVTDNYQGYDEGDLSKHVDQLKDKQFLLVKSAENQLKSLNSPVNPSLPIKSLVECRFTEQLTIMFILCRAWCSRKR